MGLEFVDDELIQIDLEKLWWILEWVGLSFDSGKLRTKRSVLIGWKMRTKIDVVQNSGNSFKD